MAEPLDPEHLADAIEGAMKAAWEEVKKTPFQTGDPKDRRPIFLAISRGLLSYLQANQSTFITSMGLSAGGAPAVANTASNVVLGIKSS